MAQSLVAFARQAWIQADANRYDGAHQEVLWKSFASRGLGVGAENYKDSSLLPAHFKPVVIVRELMKPRPLMGIVFCSSHPAQGSIVSVIVNPKTVVTISGVRDSSSVLRFPFLSIFLTQIQLGTVTWNQKAIVELIDADQKPQAIVSFNGADKAFLTPAGDSTKTVTWGPFDATMTVELSFYLRVHRAFWDISAIKADKMKEVRVCFIHKAQDRY